MMDLERYTIKQGTYKNKNVFWIGFPYSENLKKDLKKYFPSARWSATNKMWYLPDLPSVRSALNIKQREEVGDSNKSKILPVNEKALNCFVNQLKLKAYSPNTIRFYVAEFTHLLELLKNKNVNELTPEQLKAYFFYCVDTLKMKEAKMNGKMNAIKFYYEHVLHKPKLFLSIPRPKKPQTRHKKLNKNQIKRLFQGVKNPKHLLILKLCYVMGLRVNQVAHLKVQDIDMKNMQVLVADANGEKNRCLNLPISVLFVLKDYCKAFQPQEWLLEGKNGGAYSVRSIQVVIKNAMKKARIRKRVGVHGLPYNYAKQLLESGVDFDFIQEFLGSRNSMVK